MMQERDKKGLAGGIRDLLYLSLGLGVLHRH